jgi:hypothetical protein
MQGQCTQIKPDGERCQALAMAGKELCVFHDPAMAEKQAAGRKQGGKSRMRPSAVLPPTTADVQAKTSADVAKLLAETISQVRRGELDPRIGNAVGFLAATLLRAIEAAEVEDLAAEVERLKALVGASRHGPAEITGGNSEAAIQGRLVHRPDVLEHADAV